MARSSAEGNERPVGLPESPGMYFWTHAVAPVAGMLGWWACTGAAWYKGGWRTLALAGVYAVGAAWLAWRGRSRGRIDEGIASVYSLVGLLLGAPLFAAAMGFFNKAEGPLPWPDSWMGRKLWMGLAYCPMLYSTVARWLRLPGTRRKRLWSVAWLAGAIVMACGFVLPAGGDPAAAPLPHWRMASILGGSLVMTLCMARLLLDAVSWLRQRRSAGPRRGRWRLGTAAVLGVASVGSVAVWIRFDVAPVGQDSAGWLLCGIAAAALASLPPTDRGGRAGLAAWWGRWMAAPCTAYLFLEALPFVWLTATPPPLMLFGLAYLAPVLAFQHWQKDVEESWTTLRLEGHGRARLAAVAAAGIWVLPAWTLLHLAG